MKRFQDEMVKQNQMQRSYTEQKINKLSNQLKKLPNEASILKKVEDEEELLKLYKEMEQKEQMIKRKRQNMLKEQLNSLEDQKESLLGKFKYFLAYQGNWTLNQQKIGKMKNKI